MADDPRREGRQSLPLDGFDVQVDPDRPPALLAVAGRPDEAMRWSLIDLDPGPGYAAAALVEGPAGIVRPFDFAHEDVTRSPLG